jgi:hypothetical protein
MTQGELRAELERQAHSVVAITGDSNCFIVAAILDLRRLVLPGPSRLLWLSLSNKKAGLWPAFRG